MNVVLASSPFHSLAFWLTSVCHLSIQESGHELVKIEIVMYILKGVKPPIQCSHIPLNHYGPILKSKIMIFSFLLTSIIYPTPAVILSSFCRALVIYSCILILSECEVNEGVQMWILCECKRKVKCPFPSASSLPTQIIQMFFGMCEGLRIVLHA